MMPKKNNVCHVCLHITTLKNLKTAATELQAELRYDWGVTPIVQLDDHLIPCDALRWFLVSDDGKPTIIPSYSISNRMFERAFIVNPFEVDWMRFEVHDTLDMDYLFSVVEILQDMQDLWINDIDTRDHSIMKSFTRFTGSIKRLLMYAVNSSILA
jgi:hypothetical protein